MPNTLAHIGINGFLTKYLLRDSDLFWIFIGTIIPDIPWISNKIVTTIFPELIGYDLQLYLIVQASLFYCIIISFAISLLSKKTKRTFIILALGSLLHLLLDSLQTKWANGVHLSAPISWELTSFELFWPESYFSYLITALGILFIAFNFKSIIKIQVEFQKNYKIFLGFIFIIAFYLFTPFVFIKDVEKNDSHFISTLKNNEERIGKYVEMDRKYVVFNKITDSYWIESFDASFIELEGIEKLESDRISIKGNFIGSNKIRVTELHENFSLYRDGASYLGIGFILVITLIGFKNSFSKSKK